MNPQSSDSQLAEMKRHVLQYSRPDDLKAWLAMAISFLIEAVAIALIHLNLPLLGWTLHSLNLVRLFIQFHDMAHFSFFSSAPLNKLCGRLIGVIEHFPFEAWRDGHNYHHKHFGNIDRLDLSQSILFTKKQYEQMRGIKKIMVRIFRQPVVFFLVSIHYAWVFGLFYSVIKRYGLFSLACLQKTLSIVVYTFVCPLFGIPALPMWLSWYVAALLGSILFHLQHSVNIAYRRRTDKWNYTQAVLEGSTFLEIPLLLRPFTNGIEYHHIHHLNTNVPSYRIAECHQSFDKGGEGRQWGRFNINRVDLPMAVESMMNVMLDEERGLLVPF